MRFLYTLIMILSVCSVYGKEDPNLNAEKITDRDGNTFYKRLSFAEYGAYLAPIFVKDSLPTCGLAQRDHYLYTCGKRHFTIYDISNPLKPKFVSRVNDLSNDCRQICVYKNLACITARSDGLYIFDIANPKNPTLLSHYDTIELATGIACDNDTAYVCQRQFGTEFVDISAPKQPRHLGFVLSGEAQSVDTANGILYAGDWGSRKLSLFDVRNPKNPQFIGDAPLDGLGDGVYVRDHIAYAGTGLVRHKRGNKGKNEHEGNGLDIFSLEDLKAPRLLGRIKMPVLAFPIYPDLWSVQVNEEKMAYVNNTYNGVFCIDVSDPAHPKSVAYSIPWNDKMERPDFMASMAVVDDVIYAAGYHRGLWLIPAHGFAKKPGERKNLPVPPGPVAKNLPSNEQLLKDFSFYKPNGQVCAVCKDSRGKSLWVAAGMDGLHQIEIRGGKPILLQKIAAQGIVYDVKCVGDFVYTAECDKGFGIYKIGKDGIAKFFRRFNTDQAVRQIVVSEDGRWAILKVGNGVLFFLNISNPEAPCLVFKDSVSHGIMYGREVVGTITKKGIAAALFWSFGFAWYDLSGDIPQKVGLKEFRGSFFEGGAFHNDKLYYSKKACFYIFDLLDTKPIKEDRYYKVQGLDHTGKIFIDGTTSVVADRRNGFFSKIDISDPEKAKVLKRYEIKGHPDLGIFFEGRIIIPCGYAGLLIEKIQ
ncbi:MAG: hypothetical protein Q4G69_05580 [Planctomycetia bacterium]|nr:hypothetical protein [Planctomycetia bacterium]